MPDDDALDDPLDLIERMLKAQEDMTERLERLESLEARVKELEAGLGEDAEPAELDEWVAWLVPTYALEVVLQDWRTYPGMVRELAALLKAHIDVVGKRKGFDDVVWHGHLASMVTRVQALRSRTNEARQRSATQGGSLAGLIRRGQPNPDPTDVIPAESR